MAQKENRTYVVLFDPRQSSPLPIVSVWLCGHTGEADSTAEAISTELLFKVKDGRMKGIKISLYFVRQELLVAYQC